MTPQLTSIPQMLIKTRGNMSELSKVFGVTRHTIRRYARDFECNAHVVINGVLMVSQGNRGHHKRKPHEANMVRP